MVTSSPLLRASTIPTSEKQLAQTLKYLKSNCFVNMEAAAQRIEKHSGEVDNGGHGCFLGLPKLVHQQSLQDLIEDDLQSRDDGSIEMSTLLLRADGNADSDSATVAAPSSRLPDEVPGSEYRTLLEPRSDENSSPSPDVTGSKCTGKPGHPNFWRRLIRRYHYPT